MVVEYILDLKSFETDETYPLNPLPERKGDLFSVNER